MLKWKRVSLHLCPKSNSSHGTESIIEKTDVEDEVVKKIDYYKRYARVEIQYNDQNCLSRIPSKSHLLNILHFDRS